ncbi:hypothetical protein [Terrarubrum flagellatum]|uniref:hypothetical protein n=1 Tax=Terrirubrum flagellatum TaxID=2895980 RepID=UPI003144F023
MIVIPHWIARAGVAMALSGVAIAGSLNTARSLAAWRDGQTGAVWSLAIELPLIGDALLQSPSRPPGAPRAAAGPAGRNIA